MDVNPKNKINIGTTMTIICHGPEHGLTYSVMKSDVMKGTQKADPSSKGVVFNLHNMQHEDSGNYSCHYQFRGNPFVWSSESDYEEIIVQGKQPGLILVPQPSTFPLLMV